MSDWISVDDRLPIRNEQSLSVKVEIIYFLPCKTYNLLTDPCEREIIFTICDFTNNKWIFSAGLAIPEICMDYDPDYPIVIAWKEPTAAQCVKNFKLGRYAKFEDSPKLPTKTTYKYPDK